MGYCNSAEAEKQEVFSSQAYQFLARLYKEYSLERRGVTSSAQEPTKACSCALHRMIVVVTRIQLEYRINPLALVESMYLFCVLPDTSQKWVSSFVLLVTQRKVHAVRQTLWLMGADVLLYSRKPERTGRAPYTGKQVRLVDGLQSKQPGQGVSGDPTPTRNSVNLFLYRWNNIPGQKLQIVVCAAGAGLGIFESGGTVPGHHVVAPVQIADGHQSKRWTTSSMCGLIDLLDFVREGVEIDNGGSWFSTREDECSFAVYCEGLHLGSSTFYSSNCYPLKFKVFFIVQQKNYRYNKCETRKPNGALLQRN